MKRTWIRVTDGLPEIPEGLYGVTVLVAQFDPHYNEENPARCFRVGDAQYMRTKDNKGRTIRGYEGTDIEADFMGLNYSPKGGTHWGPMGDIVTHWMPLYDFPGEEWRNVEDFKPEIPEKQYALRVLTAQFDPDNGYSVSECCYSPTRYRNGKKLAMYADIDREFDYMDWYSNGELGPTTDVVTHFAYLPVAPYADVQYVLDLFKSLSADQGD